MAVFKMGSEIGAPAAVTSTRYRGRAAARFRFPNSIYVGHYQAQGVSGKGFKGKVAPGRLDWMRALFFFFRFFASFFAYAKRVMEAVVRGHVCRRTPQIRIACSHMFTVAQARSVVPYGVSILSCFWFFPPHPLYTRGPLGTRFSAGTTPGVTLVAPQVEEEEKAAVGHGKYPGWWCRRVGHHLTGRPRWGKRQLRRWLEEEKKKEERKSPRGDARQEKGAHLSSAGVSVLHTEAAACLTRERDVLELLIRWDRWDETLLKRALVRTRHCCLPRGAECVLGRRAGPPANGSSSRVAVTAREIAQAKSRSLPARQPLDPKSLFAAFRREESSRVNGKADANHHRRGDSSIDESSISSDTSCSSLEFHRPLSAGVEAPRSSVRNSPARFDAASGGANFSASCVKGSNESLTRRERLEAVKARVEAQRSRYGGSSSSDDEEDVTWRDNGKVTRPRRKSRESSAPPRPSAPVWQESRAYQEPMMVRRAGAVTPLTVTTTFQGPAAPVQPSPQDSGVSSQSVASSPSLGRAPTPPPRRTPSRALTRDSSLLAAKPRRHSASFDQWRLDDSGIGSERKDSFYSYADLTPSSRHQGPHPRTGVFLHRPGAAEIGFIRGVHE
ncbi:hypothetical protein HPB48_007399 [Haemaphysalis longicornis]|uniref:Uncharacterized protein n=1 Tax=Haemaphysalis longicornis TaxID=44386 RepID=A0A9J6G6W0_HAELO|nr:hypothetical protein HPB48_007399 [Haemaphysalis longicornis]